MSFNRYYQSELTALREQGKQFAERNPALSSFLGESGRDPDVERLLEGFAFLTGRLRQKLDDELPELTHSLMHLLWPNYMRPLPAFSMLQFDPLSRPGNAVIVARETPVESKPVEGVACRFRTAFTTEVQPIALTKLDYSPKGNGGLLNLRLMLSTEGHLGDLQLDRLRLHLSGERYISQTLYLCMLRRLRGLRIVLLDAKGKPLEDTLGRAQGVLSINPAKVESVGFDEDQALIPYPTNTFRGYRHIQEYFAFQEKFLFVDVGGLGAIRGPAPDVLKRARGFELQMEFERTGAQQIRPTLENVRLYCTPVVNLFSHDASPIRLDGRQDQYLVRPADFARAHCGVFSVDRVTGWKPGGMGHEAYVPFESFEHDPSFESPKAQRHFSVRQHPSMQGDGLDTYLSFGLRSEDHHETLSLELTCTNQNLPRRLALGDICRPCEDTPEFVSFRNISAVTSSYAPPLHDDYLWKLVSNMSLNYLSLANVEALRVVLETYDLPRHYDQHAARVSKQLLAGLKSIQHQSVDRLHRGLPVRGVRSVVQMEANHYVGEGDLFLFATILNEFLALYARLNSYHELIVHSSQGEVYQWTPRMGQQPLL